MFTLLRLIPTPYLILAAVITLGLSHMGAGYAGWKIRDNSARAEAQRATEQRLKEVEQLNKSIIELQAKARQEEAQHAQQLAAVSRTYQEKLQNVRQDNDRFIAGVRAGTIRLRLPEPRKTLPGSPAAKAVPGPGGCDGKAAGELPDAVAEFLWREASRADEITEQLAACQAIVIEDRRLSGMAGR